MRIALCGNKKFEGKNRSPEVKIRFVILPQVIKTDTENTANGERLLEGKNVNLRVAEKEDLSFALEWVNNLEFLGEYQFIPQMSRADLEKMYNNMEPEEKMFFVEKKDGVKIGNMGHRPVGRAQEISYNMLPSERGKGYCTEGVEIMVDYLFLSKDIVRVQAHTDIKNVASQRVLEKAGFKKEGVIRKRIYHKGEWRDNCLYSILREEWKEPKILTRTEKK